MSSQQQPEAQSEDAAEHLVVRYLERNPHFFDHHPALLADIQLQHACGGAASLIEKQVGALRQQNTQLRNKLMELVQVARDNDRINERMHRLSVTLLSAESIEEAIGLLDNLLREVFGADSVTLRLFGDPEQDSLGGYRIARDDLALVPFLDFLKESKPLCGRLKAAQLEYLFHEHALEIKSAALIPITADESLGFLAVGSRDPERFLLAMGTVFLTRLGELVGYLLQRQTP